MSDTNTNTPIDPPPAESESTTRERRSFPVRLLVGEPGDKWTLRKDVEPFNTIDQAERWIEKNGEPGATYMMARVIGAKRRPPTKLEDVAL